MDENRNHSPNLSFSFTPSLTDNNGDSPHHFLTGHNISTATRVRHTSSAGVGSRVCSDHTGYAQGHSGGIGCTVSTILTAGSRPPGHDGGGCVHMPHSLWLDRAGQLQRGARLQHCAVRGSRNSHHWPGDCGEGTHAVL